ncbi:thyroxine 5-deiodinase-like [Xenia sp. Carnegie-2017]|uniref:thyroxine 5-deiodinase-like n=1 Tax=Xenia sp. Carnegie-2017 TaxID=2897299 RepID=UPI001F038C90|nr:thyroxine 5-deiodinase-like [Xenia sp. Carnegie-2017]
MRNGLEAQNVPLVTPDGKKCVRLLDLLQAERALVVYFGSCSCPVFRNKLKEFGVLAQDFSDIVDFVVVYIEEAHPIDGWFFKAKTKMLFEKESSLTFDNVLCREKHVLRFLDKVMKEANFTSF